VKFTGSESEATNYLAYAEVRNFFPDLGIFPFCGKLNFPSNDTQVSLFQVWGTTSAGVQVPVAWVSGISESSSEIQFELDVGWVAKVTMSLSQLIPRLLLLLLSP
jgi:hypothetical protein